jgi:hypothetical protein
VGNGCREGVGTGAGARETEPRSRSFTLILHSSEIEAAEQGNPSMMCGWRPEEFEHGQGSRRAAQLVFTPWSSSSSDREWIRKGKKSNRYFFLGAHFSMY